jgi:hypothetical protein
LLCDSPDFGGNNIPARFESQLTVRTLLSPQWSSDSPLSTLMLSDTLAPATYPPTASSRSWAVVARMWCTRPRTFLDSLPGVEKNVLAVIPFFPGFRELE